MSNKSGTSSQVISLPKGETLSTGSGNSSFEAIATLADDSPDLKIIGQMLNFSDGQAFQGFSYPQIGEYGAPVRSLTLAMTEDNLRQAYGANRFPYLTKLMLQSSI